MKTSSAKAKGRRAAKMLADALLSFAENLSTDDIKVVPSGVPGEDLWLSPAAQDEIPFTFECKNVERIAIWDAIRQAREHAKKCGRFPAVAFTRNHEEMWVATPLSTFISLLDKGVVKKCQD